MTAQRTNATGYNANSRHFRNSRSTTVTPSHRIPPQSFNQHHPDISTISSFIPSYPVRPVVRIYGRGSIADYHSHSSSTLSRLNGSETSTILRDNQLPEKCRDWLHGQCMRGQYCRYSHNGADVPDIDHVGNLNR